ncbi:MAG: alpha/beta hydrolase [Ilumatobacter sp.]|nr:alpha/beta hydrolase [Ilumatobacter sp.]MCB0984291.1 alpha/beta hydrolase [Ilumatobacter sp.]
MPRTAVNTGMEIEYDTFGSPSDPALLLVMGFTAQMTLWEEDFCRMLADGGRYVIRFDNRDCGLSTHLDGVAADMAAPPYLLSDMAEDAFGLLTALGIERAHIAGASMGGMIVQTMAILHPERVISMTSIMSTTGEPEYGQADPEVLQVLLAPPPTDRQEFIDAAPRYRVFGSKKYYDEAAAKARAARDYDRSFYPEGSARQLIAIMASGSRADGLRTLDVPTLVIHGRDDTLIAPSGGFRTAELVPGSVLLYVSDMGHDTPPQVWPAVVGAILTHTDR